MTVLVAAFTHPADAVAGAELARYAGFPVIDALTPYPVRRLMDLAGKPPARVRLPMAVAGFGVALAAYGFQYWSAVAAYPFNSGGRPLDSWPVFLLVPFEVGVLAAAITGCVVFLLRCGFPRFNHPLFEVPALSRATRDRFLLVLDPLDRDRQPALERLLLEAGALSVSEAEG